MYFGGSSSATMVRNTAGFFAYASENWVDGVSHGSRFTIETTKNGDADRTTPFEIDGDQTFNNTTGSFRIKHSTSAGSYLDIITSASTIGMQVRRKDTDAVGLRHLNLQPEGGNVGVRCANVRY
jgi:hypothetical protein